MRDVQVVGISDPHAVSAIATLAGCPGFSSDTELYETARPDFVFAFGRHCDMAAGARELIARRIPFAMEKPCGLDAAKFGEVARLASAAAVFAAVPFVFRQGRMRETIARVTAGEAMRTLSFKFVAGGADRYRDAGCSWMLRRALSGGGCLLNLGVHFVDLFSAMVAPAAPVVVAAAMSNAHAGHDIEDHAVLVLRSGDATCLIETGYFYPARTDRFDMHFSIRTERHHFVAPDRDTLDIIDASGHLVRERMPTTNVPYYAMFVRDVLRRTAAGEHPVAGLVDMAAALRIIETAYAMAPLPGQRT